jgi:hypothetical protein
MINNTQQPVGLIFWCALSEEYSILCAFIEGAVDSDVHLSTLRGECVFHDGILQSGFQHSDVPSYTRNIIIGQYSSSVRTQQ